MKALVVSRFGDPEVLETIDVDVPDPARGEVRISVAGSAVNPIDISTRAGRLTQSGLLPERDVIGLGWDVAGTIDAVGPDVTLFAAGDRVIGLRDILTQVPGAQAEQVVLPVTAVAPAPRSVDLVQAATLPLNVLTADGALRLANVPAGGTLLVTGAAGGVGGYVLELARLRGITAIAVSSRSDENLLREMGAAHIVDRGDRLGDAVRRLVPLGVDAVIDAAVVGIEAHGALRGGGTFVTLVRPFAPPPIRNTQVPVQESFADGPRLAELSGLVDLGVLSARLQDTYSLDDAAAAHQRFAAGGLRGRLVLTP